jgi:hypothetical protein
VHFGVFRLHQAQKTRDARKQVDATLDAAESLVNRDRSLAPDVRAEILRDLRAYRLEYPDIIWRYSGRLARLGLPRSLVTRIRRLRGDGVEADAHP